MEPNKFALLLVAMAVLLLAAAAPTVRAARNEIKPSSTSANANVRNPLPNSFPVDTTNPAENCKPVLSLCVKHADCCSGRCLFLHAPQRIGLLEAAKEEEAGCGGVL
ncbi:hypothetical protein V6N13_092394 [Hibiscus sabdariffa]